MKKFSEDSKCVKCGFFGRSNVDVLYMLKDSSILLSDSHSQQTFDTDVMVRTCRRCGYCWVEKPLDNKE